MSQENTSREDVENGIVSILNSLSSNWENSFSGTIGPETRLSGDLGVDSMQFVQLVGRTESHFNVKRIPFHKLLLSDEVENDDLRVKDVVDFIHGFLND